MLNVALHPLDHPDFEGCSRKSAIARAAFFTRFYNFAFELLFASRIPSYRHRIPTVLTLSCH